MALTSKQLRFVQEYLIDLNARQAAIRAGYSEKTAAAQGSRLLTNADIQAEINIRQGKIAEKLDISAERVLQEMARLAFSDIGILFAENGSLRQLTDLTPEERAMIGSIEVVSRKVPGTEPAEIEYVHKIKSWDKPAALQMLGRHLALFKDKMEVEHSGQIDLIDRLTRARERVQSRGK